MSQFDSMCFSGGYGFGQFVVNAKKHTKEEVLELYKAEGDYPDRVGFRKPTLEDIHESFVAYRFTDSPEFEGAFYTFVEEGSRGSFPVWVIDYDELKEISQ